MYNRGLFASSREVLSDGAVLLRGFAETEAPELVDSIMKIAEAAPFRHLITPGGYRMSVAMTNCGEAGWVSDRTGYRYDACDPTTGRTWPAMPESFMALARRAALEGGFAEFTPDVCLINRYEAGSRLTMHQDHDEFDLKDPIVSVSLGLPAEIPLWRTPTRGQVSSHYCRKRRRRRLGRSGSPYLSRRRSPACGQPSSTGPYRFNLTFRRSK